MHVIYADPGLIGEFGHHANSCRAITGALRDRGHAVDVIAHQAINAGLAEELGARPHFRMYTYQNKDDDPICGWLSHFFTASSALAQDLAALGPFRPDHLVYVNSIQPAQLMGLRNFLLGLPGEQRPQVFAEFGTSPGLDYVEQNGTGQFIARDPRIDSRSIMYRFAALQIKGSDIPQLHLSTFDRSSSEIYAMLLGLPVDTLPVPRVTEGELRRRGSQRPLTIGVLGHQRGEKGYHLVPEIVRLLLGRDPDVRFLVHSAEPNQMQAAQEEMRVLAAQHPRVTLDERTAAPELWAALLAQCDLILCPYDPVSFRAGYSAVASEAIADAIPLVVPANTTLARVLGEFGSPGVTFTEHTPDSVVNAVTLAIAHFDILADRAVAGAAQWRTTMGPGAMVDAMLGQVAGGDMLSRLMQRSRPVNSLVSLEKVA